MLTFEQLVAIRERAERATPGPWKYNGLSLDPISYVTDLGVLIFENDADAKFVTKSREDVPALIAEMAHYEAPYGLDATGYEVLRIMARQALDDGGDAK